MGQLGQNKNNLGNLGQPTKLTKPNLLNLSKQNKPTNPNLPNQTYQTKPTKPNLPNKIKQKQKTMGCDTIEINLVWYIVSKVNRIEIILPRDTQY